MSDGAERVGAARAEAEEQQRAAMPAIDALDHALATLSTGDDAVEAAREVERAGVLAAEARRHTDECRVAHERAAEALGAARRSLARDAAGRGLPSRTMGRMPDEALLERVVVDPEICFGKPTIRGTRIWVGLVLGFLADGMTIPEILQEYPQLTEDDIRACLVYASRLTSGRFTDVA